ncbi:MAG: tyrosine-type recombinase/integrase [Pseudomonadota bacterium]
MPTSYLKQRGRSYYARVTLTPEQAKALGKTEIVRALGTRDRAEAKKRLPAKIVEIQDEVQAELDADRLLPHSIDWLEAKMNLLIDSYRRKEIDAEEFSEQEEILLDTHFVAKGRQQGINTNVERDDVRMTDEENRRVSGLIAKGQGKLVLSIAVEEYLDTIRPELAEKTVTNKRVTLDAFSKWAGDVTVDRIKKPMVAQYLRDVLKQNGRSRATVVKDLSHIGSLWSHYLIPNGQADTNPVTGLAASLPKTKRGQKAVREAWTDEQIIDLLIGLSSDARYRELQIAALLFLYTGMRRQELIDVTTDRVRDGGIEISEGKSGAALRTVPVHPTVGPLVDLLVEESEDGFLLPIKRTAKNVGDAFGKRFGEAREKLGLSARYLDLHAFRHSFTTAARNSGIPEHLAAILDGHEHPQMTYGTYTQSDRVN